MSELGRRPIWVAPWLVILVLSALCGAGFLSTTVGQQALVDERVRVVEAFGGAVTDAEYAAWQADPPLSVYATSGSRLLLTPIVTLAVASGLWLLTRRDQAPPSWAAAMAVTVHASVVLLVGHVVAIPFNYVRESLTSPLTLATVFPVASDGSWAARFLGMLDLFAIWWMALLAVGAAALSGGGLSRYLWMAMGLMAAVAATVAALVAARGSLA